MGATQSPCCCKKDDVQKERGSEIVRARPSDHAGFADPRAAKDAGWVVAPADSSDPFAVDTGGMAPWPATAPAPTTVPTPRAIPMEGVGREVFEDGSTYEGESRDGRRHGFGEWKSAFESYKGQWADDQRHGDGRQTWEDGRLYEGQFEDGKFHGVGRMEWYTEQGVMIFEGQYVEDIKQGTGKYSWPDGRIYDGEWLAGKRSGKAIYVNKSGERKPGLWKDDKVDRWVTPEEFAKI